MRADAPIRPDEGRRALPRPAAAVLAAVVVAACAGENLFTFPVSGGDLLGPQVEITAPVPPVTIPPEDSVEVTATLVSEEGIIEVSWTGAHEAGGAAPFTPIVVPLTAVTDTTMSRFVKRTPTSPAGDASIIVTAKDLSGDTGADTITVTLGS